MATIFNWFGYQLRTLPGRHPSVILAELKAFNAKRPRPWRTWRGSQRSPRRIGCIEVARRRAEKAEKRKGAV